MSKRPHIGISAFDGRGESHAAREFMRVAFDRSDAAMASIGCDPEPRLPIVADSSLPSDVIVVRSAGMVSSVRWTDPDGALARWADDGGRAP